MILHSSPLARKLSDSNLIKEAKDHIHFLHHELLDCDHIGLNYVIENHDITLRIPEGAVAKGEMVHFELGVATYGPFIFPKSTQLISPILWIRVLEEGIKMKKNY